ncbi:hypothetical protein DOTSEDRAFT_84193 [Dothistroma septosporum NZE10]|uniref:Uncharacterized protein n=1 Tax=Dothistroma septosporum (strain NZE10 / CBS 128990) TaxID=675120 RepID=N1PYY0_DOTSN|nr:hypothetical protein DOTSEDRAFT_84193 [Dothistroma septosporum NZE10]
MDTFGHAKLISPWQLLLTVVVGIITCILILCLQIRYRPGLRKIPGPWLASHVSFADCAMIPKVYGVGSGFWKSDFHLPFDIKAPSGMVPTVFSVRDEKTHRSIRRPIANAYALSTLKELEPMNDACSAVITRKCEEKVGQSIDLGKWLHWYAFDVITSITFSNTLGMMECERDVDNIIGAIQGRLVYNSVVGQATYLHKFLFGNEVSLKLLSLIPALESSKDEEELIDEGVMLSHSSSNIFVGSDTTAASLRAAVYYLCRTSTAHRLFLAGELSDPVTFSEAQAMLYLQAVIKEALRMHQAVGLSLERLVPRGGAEVGGVWSEGGTVVGMNPWVSARDEETYGKDAYTFRPERWLEANEDKLKLMERNFLAFGAGARTCLSKNVSILEMSKLLPQLYRRFDFELTDPTKEWTLHDYWSVSQTGLICTIKRRHNSSTS